MKKYFYIVLGTLSLCVIVAHLLAFFFVPFNPPGFWGFFDKLTAFRILPLFFFEKEPPLAVTYFLQFVALVGVSCIIAVLLRYANQGRVILRHGILLALFFLAKALWLAYIFYAPLFWEKNVIFLLVLVESLLLISLLSLSFSLLYAWVRKHKTTAPTAPVVF